MMLIIESVRNDLRFAVRQFARRPLSVATIVLVLALGIGVHSAVFSLVQAVTARPAPGVPNDAALVRVRGREQSDVGSTWFPRGLSYPELREIATLSDVLSSVAGWTQENVTLDVGALDQSGSVRAQFVTGNYFTTLGVRAALGTTLPQTQRADQTPAELVAVIGYAMWQSEFGGSAEAIGRYVRINDIAVRVIGVAPERFNGATRTEGNRTLWMPLSARATIMRSGAQSLIARDSALLQAVARLANGATIARANAAVRLTAARAVSQLAPLATRGQRDADVVQLRGDTDLPANDDAVMYAAVYGSVALLILLIACANVSALVVGTAITRRQEIAVRLSLGASRARLVRQLVTESMLLAVVGGALGLTLYWLITNIVASRFPDLNLAPDFATVAFTMCFALGTGILFGISPALHATRRGLSETLKDSTGGATSRSRLQRVFVVAQIVLTQPLLVALALLLGIVMQDTRGGVDQSITTRLIALNLNLNGSAGSRQQKQVGVATAIEHARQLPGIVGVAIAPTGISNTSLTVRPEDQSGATELANTVDVHVEATSPGYFALISVPIIRGRDLAWTDTAMREVPVIIGSGLSRKLWGAGDPIGKQLTQRSQRNSANPNVVVVGVFDSRFPTTRGGDERVFTVRAGRATNAFLFRTRGPAQPLIAQVRAQIKTDVPFIPIDRLQTWADIEAENNASIFRVSAAATAGGALTLLMAAIGLYGVVALALGQRRREIGIRIALGARPQQVVSMLFTSGTKLSVIGLALGLPLSAFAFRILAQMAKLPDISMTAVTAAIAIVVLGVASIATWIPARRAATVDPVVALRTD